MTKRMLSYFHGEARKVGRGVSRDLPEPWLGSQAASPFREGSIAG